MTRAQMTPMPLMSRPMDPVFAPLFAGGEHRRFNLYSHFLEGSRATFVLSTGSTAEDVAGWVRAWARSGRERRECLFRVFEVVAGGELFCTAYVVQGGGGDEGVQAHSEVTFPARFF